jgi:hypothetical protein
LARFIQVCCDLEITYVRGWKTVGRTTGSTA